MTIPDQSNAPADGDGYACPWLMRAMFNAGLAYCREQRLRYDARPQPPTTPSAAYNQQRDTRTVMIEYRSDEGRIMARTHQFVRGHTRQASGLGDPTQVMYEGALVRRRHKDDGWCADCATWRPRAASTARQL